MVSELSSSYSHEMEDEREAISLGMKDWEHIKSLSLQSSSSNQAHAYAEAEAQAQARSTGWEVVMRRETLYDDDDDCSVFPPSKHEGLHVSFQDDQHQEEEPEPEPEPSDIDGNGPHPQQSDSQTGVAGVIVKRLGIGFELLYSRVFRIVSVVRSRVASRGTVGLFSSATTGVAGALLLSLLYMGVRRWHRRLRQEKMDRLVHLIQEQDEKIGRLLQQITQMNEVLSARYRVPVLRNG